MPADFHIDPAHCTVFSKAVGVLNSVVGLDHMDRLQSHPDFRPEFNQIFDFREVTDVELSHGEIRRLAQRKIFSDHSRRAFVVANDFQFGIARMFGTYRDVEGEPSIAVFREMREALAWLSLPAEPDESVFARLPAAASAPAAAESPPSVL